MTQTCEVCMLERENVEAATLDPWPETGSTRAPSAAAGTTGWTTATAA